MANNNNNYNNNTYENVHLINGLIAHTTQGFSPSLVLGVCSIKVLCNCVEMWHLEEITLS